MAVTKFTPDRQPRREDPGAAMVVWWVLQQFIDWSTQNYVNQFRAGTALIGGGGTSTSVSHNLGTVSYRCVVTPNSADPGSRFWVSNKTATAFQINLSSAAPGGGVGFDWIVKGD